MQVPLPDCFRPHDRRPAIVGHRGVRGTYPENTLGAFEEAIRQGADAFELDVRVCASGEVVVLHDVDLVRVAGDPARAAEHDFRSLSRIDLGRGERVPRLSAALALARQHRVGVNVEIKHDVPAKLRVVAAVARELGRHASGVDVVVSSFDPWMLAAHRALAPRLCHAQIIHESTYHDLAFSIARRLGFSGVHVQSSLVTPARMQPFQGRAYFAVWTVNEPVEATRVANLGASAVITDVPSRIRYCFEPCRAETRSR